MPNDREIAKDSILRIDVSKNPRVSRIREKTSLYSRRGEKFLSLDIHDRIRCPCTPVCRQLPRMAARNEATEGGTVHVACVRITCPAVASRVAAARVQRYTGTKRGPRNPAVVSVCNRNARGNRGKRKRTRRAERKNRARLSCTANELSLLFCTVVNLPRICRNEEETSRKDFNFLPEIRQMSKKKGRPVT